MTRPFGTSHHAIEPQLSRTSDGNPAVKFVLRFGVPALDRVEVFLDKEDIEAINHTFAGKAAP